MVEFRKANFLFWLGWNNLLQINAHAKKLEQLDKMQEKHHLFKGIAELLR